MEIGKVLTSEAMVDHTQQTYRGEIVSAKLKSKGVNKDNNSTHFILSILFVIYKR